MKQHHPAKVLKGLRGSRGWKAAALFGLVVMLAMNPLHNSMASENKTGECGCFQIQKKPQPQPQQLIKLSLNEPVKQTKTYRPIDDVETAIRSVADTVIVGRTYRGIGPGPDGTYFVLVRL